MQTESQIKLHSYAYYVFNFVDNTQISDIQKEAILNTLSKLNEVEILHIISLEQDKFIFEESDFHKKYGEYHYEKNIKQKTTKTHSYKIKK